MSEQEKTILRRKTGEPSKMFRLLMPAAILALAAITVVIMVKTKPKPKPKSRGERPYMVTVTKLTKSTEQVFVHSSGTVLPSAEITFYPRVSGQVASMDPRFIPGGQFRKNEVILQLDPLDYETAFANSRASLAKAHGDLLAEEGLQEVARHEWRELKAMNPERKFTDLEKNLALRAPNLLVAEQNLKAAEAQTLKAKADVERTSLKAPFNCTVRERYVNVGSQVSAQTPVAVLSGTDSFWIRATVPVSTLKWIRSSGARDSNGSTVRVKSVPGVDLDSEWDGYVLRIAADLEPEGRQAQLIIEVPEPDSPVKGEGRLLIGSYVRVAVAGETVEGIFKIPSSALHGGSKIWIMDKNGRLEIRPVDVVWHGSEYAFLGGGVEEGESIVVSDLSTPASGMLLKDVDKKQTPASGAKQKQGKQQSK